MSKKWEYTPSDLRIFSAEAQLSTQQKKNVMARLKSDAREGATHAILFFETSTECRLTKSYLQSLGYEIAPCPGCMQAAFIVSWEGNKK